MERYVDRKLDKAEDLLKDQKRKAKTWYNRSTSEGSNYQVTTTQIFVTGFVIGLSIGYQFYRR